MPSRSRARVNYAESSASSEADTSVDLITIDEIFKYYNVEPGVGADDPEILATQRQRKREMCQRTIDRINRNLPMIRQNWADATPLQIYIAFNMSCGDPEEMVFQIRDPSFLARVDNEAKEREIMLNPRSRAAHLRNLNKARQAELEESEESDSEPSHTKSRSDDSGFIKHHKKHIRRAGPTCNISCPAGVDKEEWAKWSDIHRSSYLIGMKNPNTYLYRNCPPGEKQKNGPWSEDEKILFLERLEEMKELGLGTSQWGIFSEKIPGRVGYQCSNFYRKLVQSGEIIDHDYVQDAEGKWHFRKSAVQKTNNHTSKSVQLSWYDKKALKNPFPKEIDFITKTEIKVPAMSPDGYILDYQTWLSLLKERSQDPFTGKKINKRQLVILTKKNVDEYRDQIKNLTSTECDEE